MPNYSPLADQLAGLRAITRPTAHRGIPSNPIHTLILAILARLFARLEQIFLLWQAGNLPAPQATRHPQSPPSRQRPNTTRPHRRASARRDSAQRASAPHAAPQPTRTNPARNPHPHTPHPSPPIRPIPHPAATGPPHRPRTPTSGIAAARPFYYVFDIKVHLPEKPQKKGGTTMSRRPKLCAGPARSGGARGRSPEQCM